MPPLIELKNVTKIYGGGFLNKENQTVAVNKASFTIEEDNPRIVTIAGESGSGKTTMTRMLLGSIKPTHGQMFYRGKDFATLSRKERRQFQLEVQPIFQDPFESYNPFYKVDHVLHAPIKNFKLASSTDERDKLVMDSLRMVGLQPDETLGRFPHQLSGGQRQRVMVARALLLKPRVILADEPVSMVDASLRATILDSIQTLNRELGITIIYITHDLTTAFQISDDILIMYRGNVVEYGDVERVIHNPRHAYTRLLIESIPQPDPDKRWGELARATGTDIIGGGKQQDIFGIEPGTEQDYEQVEPNHWVLRAGIVLDGRSPGGPNEAEALQPSPWSNPALLGGGIGPVQGG